MTELTWIAHANSGNKTTTRRPSVKTQWEGYIERTL